MKPGVCICFVHCCVYSVWKSACAQQIFTEWMLCSPASFPASTSPRANHAEPGAFLLRSPFPLVSGLWYVLFPGSGNSFPSCSVGWLPLPVFVFPGKPFLTAPRPGKDTSPKRPTVPGSHHSWNSCHLLRRQARLFLSNFSDIISFILPHLWYSY